MSGPKTSRYTLTAAQRRAIQEQLRLAQEKLVREEKRKSEVATLKNYCSNIDTSVEEIKRILEQIKQTVLDGNLESVDVSAFEKKCADAREIVKRAQAISRDGELEVVQKENKELNSMLQQLGAEKTSVLKALKKQEDVFKEVTLSRLSAGFNVSFAGITNRRALKENEYIPRILEALDSVKNITLSEQLSKRFEEVRGKAGEITSADFLGNYYSITVLPFVKACKEYSELWDKHGDEYQTLVIRYELLAKELNVTAESIPFGEDAITILLTKISELEQIILERKEESYICQCIDEAMVELGYKVAGRREVTKKSGKHFRNELYKFDEGTVVNVTYADDGQITMELGAVDTVDRVPSDAESRSLVEDMTKFCGEYAELESRLMKKGVETKRISILPPHSEYAQIIDISEYEMSDSVGEYSHKRTHTGGTTALHREV